MEDWTIELHNGGLYATDTTDANGYYEFTVKKPGSYNIKEVLKDEWTEIYPILTDSPRRWVNPLCARRYTSVSALSGIDVSGKDFWNFQWLKISGIKFFDADGDGNKETGEPGLQNWVIKLDKGTTLYGSDTTDVDGYYEIY